MVSHLNNFSVDIKNLKFVTDEGKTLPKTAILTFNETDNRNKKVELYGYIDTDEIYKLIDDNQDICLDYCYIERLSLTEYRNTKDLGKKDIIKIKSFSAKNAFFNSLVKIDFSFTEFENRTGKLREFMFCKRRFIF